MEGNKEQGLVIRWVTLRLVERFKNVLYPIDIPILLQLLPTIGYIVPVKTLKGVLEAGLPLAAKGNVELVLNQDNKTLGVEGRDFSEVMSSFVELRKFWLEQLGPSPAVETHYVELGGQAIIKSTKNPVEVFSRFWSTSERMKTLSAKVGFEVANFGLRLVHPNVNPNATDWFDLRIQPQIISSASQYYLNIVWRNKDMEKAMGDFNRLNQIVFAAIKEVEKT